jgi:DNA-binding NarL/FixJ family response regulator
MEREIKILLADDHPIYREGLIKIIEKEKHMKVYYSVGGGIEALEIIQKKKPSVAILDISMPGLSGLEIAKKIFLDKLATKPIILTMYTEEEYLEEAMQNEVHGYLLKNSTEFEIIDCINAVLSGAFYISKELVDNLIAIRKNQKSKNEIEELIMKLTPAEKQILKLLSQNKTSSQIAAELFISFRTVQNHRNNISHKLGFSGYNKLLLFAIQHKHLLN